MTQEFDLTMFIPGMTYSDVENMTTIERAAIYKRLSEFLKKKYGN